MFRSILLICLALGVSAFTNPVLQQQRTDVKLFAEVDRRTMLANAVAGVLLVPSAAFAKLDNIPKDNAVIKEQIQVVGKVDVNNSPVADYMQLPGMYPGIAGKIANSGPYKSVSDVYKLKDLSGEEKNTIKKYESVLTATEAMGMDTMRGRDPYRKSFNQFATLTNE